MRKEREFREITCSLPDRCRDLLAAACEHRNLLLLDPITRKVITSLEKAHDDCVNCVR